MKLSAITATDMNFILDNLDDTDTVQFAVYEGDTPALQIPDTADVITFTIKDGVAIGDFKTVDRLFVYVGPVLKKLYADRDLEHEMDSALSKISEQGKTLCYLCHLWGDK